MKSLRYALALLAALGGASVARALDNSDCFACHSDKTLVKSNATGKVVSLFVDEKAYKASIHGKNLCTSCHADITDVPHPDNFKHKPVACSNCHRLEADIYLKSDHGRALSKGVTEAATCKDCHGHSHTLLNYRNPDSPVHRINIHDTCAKCHAKTDEMAKFGLSQVGPVISYDRSVHGLAMKTRGISASAVCTDCHGSHDLHKSTNPESKLYWQKIPATCGKCHENVQRTYQRSVHGKAVAAGERDAPACTDCHGEHTISAVAVASSKVAASHIPETCGQCHGAERIASRYRLSTKVVETYMQSFHGLAQQFGGLSVANCASCHGFHDILPSSDPLSSVNKANLPQTCGKCHPGIGTRLAKGEIKIHNLPGADKGKPWLVNFVSWFYIVIIVVTIGGMFTFVTIDYIAKTRAHIARIRAEGGELRFTPWVRTQHFLLMGSFITLAYTGFVHRYPEAFYSYPFKLLENGGYIRGMIHRLAGWGFVALFAVHLVALFCTPRGHAYLRDLWLRMHDLRDSIAQLLFNLRLRQTPPPPRRFNYAEKAEYWALIWGSLVMIVTGVMLIFTETVLRTLPKVWHDVAQVIHFYEAVLATLAILVWHLYWVIYDPKEYPMNPAWLIGKKASHHPDPAPVAGSPATPGGHNQESTPHAPP